MKFDVFVKENNLDVLEKNREAMNSFAKKLKEIEQQLIEAGKNDVANDVSQYADALLIVSQDFNKIITPEQKEVWEKAFDIVADLKGFLYKNDNLKDIINVGQRVALHTLLDDEEDSQYVLENIEEDEWREETRESRGLTLKGLEEIEDTGQEKNNLEENENIEGTDNEEYIPWENAELLIDNIKILGNTVYKVATDGLITNIGNVLRGEDTDKSALETVARLEDLKKEGKADEFARLMLEGELENAKKELSSRSVVSDGIAEYFSNIYSKFMRDELSEADKNFYIEVAEKLQTERAHAIVKMSRKVEEYEEALRRGEYDCDNQIGAELALEDEKTIFQIADVFGKFQTTDQPSEDAYAWIATTSAERQIMQAIGGSYINANAQLNDKGESISNYLTKQSDQICKKVFAEEKVEKEKVEKYRKIGLTVERKPLEDYKGISISSQAEGERIKILKLPDEITIISHMEGDELKKTRDRIAERLMVQNVVRNISEKAWVYCEDLLKYMEGLGIADHLNYKKDKMFETVYELAYLKGNGNINTFKKKLDDAEKAADDYLRKYGGNLAKTITDTKLAAAAKIKSFVEVQRANIEGIAIPDAKAEGKEEAEFFRHADAKTLKLIDKAIKLRGLADDQKNFKIPVLDPGARLRAVDRLMEQADRGVKMGSAWYEAANNSFKELVESYAAYQRLQKEAGSMEQQNVLEKIKDAAKLADEAVKDYLDYKKFNGCWTETTNLKTQKRLDAMNAAADVISAVKLYVKDRLEEINGEKKEFTEEKEKGGRLKSANAAGGEETTEILPEEIAKARDGISKGAEKLDDIVRWGGKEFKKEIQNQITYRQQMLKYYMQKDETGAMQKDQLLKKVEILTAGIITAKTYLAYCNKGGLNYRVMGEMNFDFDAEVEKLNHSSKFQRYVGSKGMDPEKTAKALADKACSKNSDKLFSDFAEFRLKEVKKETKAAAKRSEAGKKKSMLTTR